MSVITDFETAMDSVANKVTGIDSIYDKTLAKLDALYTSFGMSADLKAKAIAEVSAQLAVSTTNAAINAAVDLAKSNPVVAAQSALINNQANTELKKALQIDRQTEGFDDKLKVEAMKAMGGVASMEAVNSGVTAGTLSSLNDRINAVVAAAV